MNIRGEKVAKFMQLAGQTPVTEFREGSPEERKLGAHLLLSEVLEYIIDGLGVTPVINGVTITDPEQVSYEIKGAPDRTEMLDGLSDVGYTMWWNAHNFGIPLAPGYDLVCDNNLEKFVRLGNWARGRSTLDRPEWDCRCGITWPAEVEQVEIVECGGDLYAVGKDARGKVRKPSSYKPVDLSSLASAAGSASK